MTAKRARFARVAGMLAGVLGFGLALFGVGASPAVAAAMVWSPPVNLATGLVTMGVHAPEMVFDSDGNAIAVWSLYDGVDFIVQSGSSGDGGATWSTPVDLSAAGGDAYSPQISVDSSGTVFAIWEFDDGIVESRVQTSSSTDGGATWSTPVDLSAAGGVANSPQISVDSSGTAIAIWIRFDGINAFVQSRSSTDGGETWLTPVNNLSAAGGDAYSPQISVDSSGTVFAIWNRSVGGGSIPQSSSSVNGGVTWSTPVDLSAPGGLAYNPQISVDSSGTVFAIWVRSDSGNFLLQTSSSVNGGVTWSTPVDPSPVSGSKDSPQISVDSSGNVFAIWSRYDDSNWIVQSSSSGDGGVTWSTPVDLSEAGGNTSSPRISVDSSGTAIASWVRYDNVDSIVQSSSSGDGGVTWSTPVDLSAAGGSSFFPQVSVDSSGTAIAIWLRLEGEGSNSMVQASSLGLQTLPDTGTTPGTAATTLGVGAALLTVGALAIVVLRRHLPARSQ
jgi:hypothetical protein